MLVAMAETAQASVLTLDYSTSDLGGGEFEYDFKLRVTNQDGTYFDGQNFDWIMFADQPFGRSPLESFLVLTETFPGHNMELGHPTGGHRGPGWLDLSTFVGWVPNGVNDSVTWSGTATANVTSGLLFSNILGSGVRSNFQEANYVASSSPAVPEPTSLALLAIGGIGASIGAYRKKHRILLGHTD